MVEKNMTRIKEFACASSHEKGKKMPNFRDRIHFTWLKFSSFS